MDSRPIHTISLCTGGAGLDLALELAVPSARAVCMVEREAFAIAQLVSAMEAGHLAPAPIWSDVRTFDGRPWRGLVDGLIGGIPCQPHSLAGRKLGQHDGRDLWSDARRIVATARPWFVLIENVSGMLSAGADEVAGAERVWRDLRKLGYSVEGGLFAAAEVGASHERERIFILGVADTKSIGEHQIGAGDEAVRRGRLQQSARIGAASDSLSGVGMADTDSEGWQGREPARSARSRDEGSTTQRSRGTLADAELGGREGWQSPRRGAGAVVPSDSTVVDAIGSGRAGRPDDALGGQEQRTALERSIRFPVFPPGPSDIPGWRSALERAPELEPAFRRVADGLASRLDIARVDRLRLLGNGVVPLQAAYALRTLIARLARRGSAGADELVRLMV